MSFSNRSVPGRKGIRELAPTRRAVQIVEEFVEGGWPTKKLTGLDSFIMQELAVGSINGE